MLFLLRLYKAYATKRFQCCIFKQKGRHSAGRKNILQPQEHFSTNYDYRLLI